MIIEPGLAACVSHGVVLLAGAVFTPRAYQSMGFSDVDPLRNNTDINSIVAVILFTFLPTFTVACFGFTWLCCLYNNETGGYLLVIAPIFYVVLLVIWMCSGACKFSCFGFCKDWTHSSTRGMTKTERVMYRNNAKERTRKQRAVSGSLFAKDAYYYEDQQVLSPSQRRAAMEYDTTGIEHSPYLMERLREEQHQEAQQALHQLERKENAERQKRFNKAFEQYSNRVASGEEVGPFIFEGEIIPTDEHERAHLEALRNGGGMPIFM